MLKVISRFASIGPVAGAPNLGYLEVLTSQYSVSVKMFKMPGSSEHLNISIILDVDVEGAKIPDQCDRFPWDRR